MRQRANSVSSAGLLQNGTSADAQAMGVMMRMVIVAPRRRDDLGQHTL